MFLWNIVFSFLVLTNFIYSPFVQAFPGLKVKYPETVLQFETTIEILWLLHIIFTSVKASAEYKIFTVRESLKRYLLPMGMLDILATGFSLYMMMTPPEDPETLKTLNKYSAVVLFIRFLHFGSMFYPILHYIRNHTNMNRKRQAQIQNVIQTFTFMLFLAHILACYLVIIGTDPNSDLDAELWVANNQGLWLNDADIEAGATITRKENLVQIYVFSYYWIWEVITTVGYGDRSVTNNKSDISFTLLIEFFGVIMQAILINTMTDFVAGDYSFGALVNEKLEPLQLWIQKIQVSNKPYYMNPKLYKKIVQNVEDAFFFDHNMIIEEFSFYQMLPPHMQTAVIKEAFSEFLRNFDHLLGSWEVGFKNAFVINLYNRNYKEYDVFIDAGYEVSMVIMVVEGSVQMLTKEKSHFMTLPKFGVYGEYNVAFGANSLATLRGAPLPDDVIVPANQEVFTCKTMNCQDEVFQELMELYPDTAANIKIRALEKREVLVYYLMKTRYLYLTRTKTNIEPKLQEKFDKWLELTTCDYDDELDSDEYEFHITKPFTLSEDKYKDPDNLEKEAEFFSEELEGEGSAEEHVQEVMDSIASTCEAIETVLAQFHAGEGKGNYA